MKRVSLGLVFAACFALHIDCATVQRIALDCAAELSADVLRDVSEGMDAGKAALEALAVKYGLDAVRCAVSHYLTDEIGRPSIGPNVRALNGRAFLEAHR